jgi:membrane protease YdiL (CAAX protease family)
MKFCEHCGQENADYLDACGGCGTALPAANVAPRIPPVWPEPSPISPIAPPVLSLLEPLPSLRAGPATLVLASYIVTQLVVGIMMGGVAGVVAGMRHIEFENFVEALMPWMLIVMLLASGAAGIIAAVMLAPDALKDRRPVGAAWVRGSWPAIGGGLLIGILVALGLTVFSALGPALDPEKDLGPIARMAIRSGFSQYVWVASVLLLAPPFEELLFRGVLYAGYRQSLGSGPAAILTTLIFLVLHIPEAIHIPAALLGIGSMALCALWCRLRSSAIGPAIAVHFGYNAVVTLTNLWGP